MNSKKYKKIYRIKSEDIVADIKDIILHCKPFKVRAPLFFFDSVNISSICNSKCTSEKNKLWNQKNSNLFISRAATCEIDMTIKTFWFSN